MRWLGWLVLFVASTATAKPSNPAFLGIGMGDKNGRGVGPCEISSVEKDTGAQRAGLRRYDLVVGIDGRNIPNCDALVAVIQSRDPGEIVKLDIHRAGVPIRVKAQLLSRDEVLRRRFVGQPVPSAILTRVDNRTEVTLDAQPNKTTIVGWFSTSCGSCSSLFRTVDTWRHKLTRGTPLIVFGASAGPENKSAEDVLAELQSTARTLEVPLLATDVGTYKEFAMSDADRVHFMVIDCRGVVQYVAPIAPDGDDTDAALDELYAAAEQAARRMK